MTDQLPTTMRAVRQRGYGGVEVLDLGEVPVPKPARDRCSSGSRRPGWIRGRGIC